VRETHSIYFDGRVYICTMIKPVFAGQAFLSRHQYAVRRIGDFLILRQGCRHMKHWILFLAVALATSEVHAFTRVWSNNSGGGWQVATNWTPPIVPGAGDVAVVTNLGTYSVQVTNNVTLDALFIGGPGSPTVVIDNNATLACSNNLVAAGGTMLWSNSWISGALTIQPGGQLLIASPAGVAYLLAHHHEPGNGDVEQRIVDHRRHADLQQWPLANYRPMFLWHRRQPGAGLDQLWHVAQNRFRRRGRGQF
jgi:hypothetical protein